MFDPKLNYVSCPHSGGVHRMAFWQWGEPSASHVVICVHGLSRQGRDFSALAARLCESSGPSLRVLALDIVGRGESDWLSDPSAYQFSTYVADVGVLVRQLAESGVSRIDWVGTSMGGVIGMIVFGSKGLGALAGSLVLNDVGPVTQWSSIQRIKSYLGKAPEFDSVPQALDYLREISQGFGPHTEAQWAELNHAMLRRSAGGRWRLHYDPRIAAPLDAVSAEALMQGEAALWALYDAISEPTLLIRGAQSDLLSPAVAREMGARGPRARLVEFAGIGHAPTLQTDDQTQTIERFLLAPAS